jgi:acetylornithine deacetylase/succinyl-diaminopimelate desuccinylase-like protein
MPPTLLTVLVAAAAGLWLTAPLKAQTTTDLAAAVRSWRGANEVAILRELADLLAIPNLASDDANIRRNAAHIRGLLEKRGIRTELLEYGGPPAVYAELTVPGATRTVMVYAHYDGQPVNAAHWASPPWTPTLRDGRLEQNPRDIPLASVKAPVPGEWRLYGRSASDDKSPLVAVLAAIDALRSSRIPLSVNVKFFLEGEEEAGSPNLAAALTKYDRQLRADAWLLCDGPVHQTRRMLVDFGVRGVMGLEMTVYGPSRVLHSGHYGNWAPNPASMLARLLASMRADDGAILMRGFADAVRPPSDSELRAIAAAPMVDDALRRELALGRTEGGGDRVELTHLRPALNIRGLAAGAVGAGAANGIPSDARASIDFRLVPDLVPAKVRELTEAHVRAQGYHVVYDEPDAETRRRHLRVIRLEWGSGYPAYRTDMDLPVSRAAIRIVGEVRGEPPVVLPTLGGSLPVHLFAERAPLVGLPIVNHDNNQHAANENLRLQNLWDGIEIFAALLARLGPEWDQPRSGAATASPR